MKAVQSAFSATAVLLVCAINCSSCLLECVYGTYVFIIGVTLLQNLLDVPNERPLIYVFFVLNFVRFIGRICIVFVAT